jgi:hypothetical protein
MDGDCFAALAMTGMVDRKNGGRRTNSIGKRSNGTHAVESTRDGAALTVRPILID